MPLDFPRTSSSAVAEGARRGPRNDFQREARRRERRERLVARAAGTSQFSARVASAMRIRKRHIAFAWGPATDRALALHRGPAGGRRRGASEGGRGRVCFERLALRERARGGAARRRERMAQRLARATLHARPRGAARIQRRRAALEPGRAAGGYDVELSSDGARWRVAAPGDAGGGGLDALLPAGNARPVSFACGCRGGPGRRRRSARVWRSDLALGGHDRMPSSRDARARRRAGAYPARLLGRADLLDAGRGRRRGARSGLLSEDGALEADAGERGRRADAAPTEGLVTWADVRPRTARRRLPCRFRRCVASPRRRRVARDRLRRRRSRRMRSSWRDTPSRTSGAPRKITLVLAVRPLQVNPPAQFLEFPRRRGVRRSRWHVDGKAVADRRLRRVLTRSPRPTRRSRRRSNGAPARSCCRADVAIRRRPRVVDARVACRRRR